jgi:hypothetical protein
MFIFDACKKLIYNLHITLVNSVAPVLGYVSQLNLIKK